MNPKLETTEDQINKLKSLAAAYEGALWYDYCPDEETAATIPEDYVTQFTAEHFRLGAKENQGRRADEIANSITALIAKL